MQYLKVISVEGQKVQVVPPAYKVGKYIYQTIKREKCCNGYDEYFKPDFYIFFWVEKYIAASYDHTYHK